MLISNIENVCGFSHAISEYTTKLKLHKTTLCANFSLNVSQLCRIITTRSSTNGLKSCENYVIIHEYTISGRLAAKKSKFNVKTLCLKIISCVK